MSNYKSTLQSNNTALNANNLDLQSLIDQANALPDAGGVELPELTNEGSASDLLSGKQLIDQDGNVVTGTIATKTALNLTVSGATVTVPAGYYASQATKSVFPAPQATPSITVDSAGKITATATQSAGYVSAGTKSGTKQLTTQAAKTITPTKSAQTAVASGVYTTGAVTVAAIPSQYITTTDATASADEIMSGETAYVNGSKVTGTFSIDAELNTQDDLISQIQTALAGKAGGGEQATPVISVNNSNGLITATAGAKSSTHQLAFQAAKTITPGTTSQIAVSSGYYTGGNITVAGDSNLVANNIVSGKTIFGVVGTATVGDDPFASTAPFTYTVDAISNAQYGFAKNSNGYYESQNKGQNSSYAICRVNLTVTSTCDITFDVINYAESVCDYALFGDLNKALSLSNTADSSNVKKNFQGQQSASVVNVTYTGVTAGTHFIDIKFRKDGSQHSNNDSVQFKIQEQSGLSQETINKILAADSDLIAENIKSGVNIFGVNGTYVGDGSEADVLIAMTMSEYTNNRVSSIGKGVFAYTDLKSVNFPNVKTIGSNAFTLCSSLTSVNFPECTTIGSSAFTSCSSLTSISFPKCTTISNSAFRRCSSLTSINFPKCTTIGSAAFSDCSSLTSVSFPVCTTIGSAAFSWCSSLTSVSFPKCATIGSAAFSWCSSLTSVSFPKCATIGNYAFTNCRKLSQFYLTGSSVCKLSNSNAFSSTPYAGYSSYFSGTPYIYVPQSLVTSYKTATNWTYFSSYFSAIENVGDGDGDSGGSNDNQNIIIFTIDDNPYQAEEGMTWSEWCGESKYNPDGYVVYGTRIYSANGDKIITNVVSSDIIESIAYSVMWYGGSN